jgi:hypothetical protein
MLPVRPVQWSHEHDRELTCPSMIKAAKLSSDNRYRYALWRTWDAGRPSVLFLGLNPSTADGERDDPTVRRYVGFAKRWGYGTLSIGNLFALRTPSPRTLCSASDPIGPRNDWWLRQLADDGDLIVAAWGGAGTWMARDREVRDMLGAMVCLGHTRSGQPRHPLYVRRATRLRDLP